jgi:predicted dehydrogenase
MSFALSSSLANGPQSVPGSELPTKPLGIAVLGAGRWGRHWIRNVSQCDRAKLVAVADPSPLTLQQVVKDLRLPPQVQLQVDWRQVIANPAVEAIVVATPAATHFEVIRAALAAGCHVLAEKPLTLNSHDGQMLCQLAEQQDRLLMVDHTYLFHPAIAAGRDWLWPSVGEAGWPGSSIGELRYGYASRTHLGPVRQDVDALWDLAIHDIAIFNHWLRDMPIAVQAQGQIWLQPDQRTLLSPRGLADQVWAMLYYPSGFTAQIHLAWNNPDKQRRLVMVGDRGALIFDELSEVPLVAQLGQLGRSGSGFVPERQSMELIPVAAEQPLDRVLAHFLDCVASYGEPGGVLCRSDGALGNDLVTILLALSESLQRGGERQDLTWV